MLATELLSSIDYFELDFGLNEYKETWIDFYNCDYSIYNVLYSGSGSFDIFFVSLVLFTKTSDYNWWREDVSFRSNLSIILYSDNGKFNLASF